MDGRAEVNSVKALHSVTKMNQNSKIPGSNLGLDKLLWCRKITKNLDAVVLLLPTKPNLTKGMLEEESKQRQLKAYVCVHLQKCVNARHLQTDQASGKTMVYRPTPFSQQKSTYGQEGY